MSDDLAIRLFVRDGGAAGEWHAVDQRVRNHYEKLALGEDCAGELENNVHTSSAWVGSEAGPGVERAVCIRRLRGNRTNLHRPRT